jgi:hypothetical protein
MIPQRARKGAAQRTSNSRRRHLSIRNIKKKKGFFGAGSDWRLLRLQEIDF